MFDLGGCCFITVSACLSVWMLVYVYSLSLIYMLSYHLTASVMSLQQPATLSLLKVQVGDLSNMHLAACFVVKHEWKHHFNVGPRHSKGKHLERHSDWGVSQKTCFPPHVSILGLWSTSRCFQSNHLWSFRKEGGAYEILMKQITCIRVDVSQGRSRKYCSK